LQRRQEARARVAGRHLQLVDGGGDVERRSNRVVRSAAVAQGVAGGVEMVRDAAQRPLRPLKDLAAGIVAAEQVDIEAARQQGVDDLSKIRLAVLEVSGRISIISK